MRLAGHKAVAGPQARLTQRRQNLRITLGNQVIQVQLKQCLHDRILLPSLTNLPVGIGWEALVFELLLPLLLVTDRRCHRLNNVRAQLATGPVDNCPQLIQTDEAVVRTNPGASRHNRCVGVGGDVQDVHLLTQVAEMAIHFAVALQCLQNCRPVIGPLGNDAPAPPILIDLLLAVCLLGDRITARIDPELVGRVVLDLQDEDPLLIDHDPVDLVAILLVIPVLIREVKGKHRPAVRVILEPGHLPLVLRQNGLDQFIVTVNQRRGRFYRPDERGPLLVRWLLCRG